jgi:hypothetical protein
MRPILIIQNDPHEDAGQLNTILAERSIKKKTVLGYSAHYGALSPQAYAGLFYSVARRPLTRLISIPTFKKKLTFARRSSMPANQLRVFAWARKF